MSGNATQQSDPEAQPLFEETKQTLDKKLDSNINVWF